MDEFEKNLGILWDYFGYLVVFLIKNLLINQTDSGILSLFPQIFPPTSQHASANRVNRVNF